MTQSLAPTNQDEPFTGQPRGDLSVLSNGSPAETARPTNPTQLQRPSFLLNAPFTYTTDEPNNVWALEDRRQPNATRAMTQFLELYRYLSSEGLVYVLPSPQGQQLQDLVFTANLGIVLEHLPGQNVVVVSNYTSEPRRGETPVGVDYFRLMGYETHVPDSRFEGEAELKHLHDNVYIGGYGQRSERSAYEWMADKFDMKVIPIQHDDPYLYHLDCSIFPITREDTLVCTELYTRDEVAQIEQYTNIVDVSIDDCYSGLCNSVRCANTILNGSHIHELKRGTDDYNAEVQKNRRLEDIAGSFAMEVSYFNLSEYLKGGALLSCMVMHLNRYSYAFKLI